MANGASKNTFSLGAGLLLQPTTRFTLGASIDHLNRPNISLGNGGYKKEPVYKFGFSFHHVITPHLELSRENHIWRTQAGLAREFLAGRLRLNTGYGFSGDSHRDIFVDPRLAQGQIGFSYTWRQAFPSLDEISSGSHLVSLLFDRERFPDADAKPRIFLLNPAFSQVKNPTLKIAGRAHSQTGVTRVVIMRNDEVAAEIFPDDAPETVNLAYDLPLQERENTFEIIAHAGKRKSSKRFRVTFAPEILPPAASFFITPCSQPRSMAKPGR